MSRSAGQSLVELALVALVLYLLLAGTVELGRATFAVQALEDAARVAAREVALLPFAPGESTVGALTSDAVLARVYDPDLLVVDLEGDLDGNTVVDGEELDALFGRFPVVNQTLRPLFVFDFVDLGAGPRRLLRYPGALVVSATSPTGLTVRIPRVVYSAAGEEIVDWLDVLEPAAPGADPFPLASGGLVALRLHYPFQAAALTGYRDVSGPLDPNLDGRIEADLVTDTSGETPTLAVASTGAEVGTNAGAHGLGVQLAYGERLRPFRRVQTAQAVFRRELFGSP